MVFNPFGKDNEESSDLTSDVSKDELSASEELENKKVDEVQAETQLQEEKKQVVKTIKKSRKMIILEQYGGLESNIPITSPYWRLK